LIGFWYFNTNGFQERLSTAWFLNIFEHDPDLSLLNTWWPKPQTTYEKIMMVWMIFDSKLLSSFVMLAIYSFLKYLRNRQPQTSSGNVEKIHRRFGSPLRDQVFDPPPPFGFWSILWKPLG